MYFIYYIKKVSQNYSIISRNAEELVFFTERCSAAFDHLMQIRRFASDNSTDKTGASEKIWGEWTPLDVTELSAYSKGVLPKHVTLLTSAHARCETAKMKRSYEEKVAVKRKYLEIFHSRTWLLLWFFFCCSVRSKSGNYWEIE